MDGYLIDTKRHREDHSALITDYIQPITTFISFTVASLSEGT